MRESQIKSTNAHVNAVNGVIITKSTEKLLTWVHKMGIKNIITDLQKLHDQVAYFSQSDLGDDEKTALFTQNQFIRFLRKIKKEMV